MEAKDSRKGTKFRIFGQLATQLSLAFLIIMLPLSAHAGIISFLSNFFVEKGQAQVVIGPNSQQIDLLNAPIASNLSIGGADISVVDGNSLVSVVGPAGSSGDEIKEKGQINIYVVREGDTISQIAEMFNVSVNTIKWGNDIKGNVLIPGQTLVILPVSGVRHTVKKGDTLAGITRAYKGDIKEVMDYNDVDEKSKLVVGSEIIIPNGMLITSTSLAKSSKSSSQAQPEFKGYFLKPVNGSIRSQGIHGYNGVDLAAPIGTEILASADGSVTVSRSSGWNGGYGNYIVISHPNGTQTLYSHASQNAVSVGEFVTQGQVIGYVGSTGRSSGPHLHFEVRGAKNPF